MGCQKEISTKIPAGEAQYVLSLKDNQKSLHADVASIFEKAEAHQYKKILHRKKN